MGGGMRRVLITGASRGLGEGLVACYHARGWETLALVRTEADAAALRQGWPGCHAIVADVGRDDAVAIIAAAVQAHGQRLDLLINNAGNVARGLRIDDVVAGDVTALLEVHCVGALRCVQAALPGLRATSGAKIVNVTSRLGSMGRYATGEFAHLKVSYAYRIAKAAQNMLTLCLGQDPSLQGIAVYGLHPGKVATAIAAPDAVLSPRAAADRMADWIDAADATMSGRCFDLDLEAELAW
jgi:NAD(P)-dependent dehydrogenase (short-subunit alcohol dehydrogenase family)